MGKQGLVKILLTSAVVSTLFFFSAVFVFAGECSVENLDECSLEEAEALKAEYEKKIAECEGNIARTEQEQETLNNRIYLLRQQIQRLDYEIYRSNIVINDLAVQVQDTQVSIGTSSKKIEAQKQRLAGLLRTIYEEDQKSSLEIFLANDGISGFFEDVFALETLLAENQELLEQIRVLKTNLEWEKDALEEEKIEWKSAKQVQILQKEESQRVKGEKEDLLDETRGEEAVYQKLLQENRERAQKIRERIFSLIGVPEAPTFGEALEMARYVEDITGVRPPFLLAILRQESDIGKNVGQCYLKNFDTGTGVVSSTGVPIERVMKPSRDVPHFIKTCEEVGRDPKNTLVSCPMSFGYGGAMGPAQFIPSTWVLFKNKVAAVTGKPADPWNIKDAFLAAGFLLKDAGASAQTYNKEWCAAMVYFSGSCSSGYNFYGNSVMSLAAQYEEDIEQMEKFVVPLPLLPLLTFTLLDPCLF